MGFIIGHGRYGRLTYPETGAGSAAASGTEYVFVLKPGATQKGNVYPDSNSLFAAVLNQRAETGDASAIIIEINGSLAPATWLANGVQDMSGVTLFSSQQTAQGFTLNVANGVQWTFDTLYNDGVTVVSAGGSTPVTIASGITSFIIAADEAGYSSNGASPFFEVKSGGTLQAITEFSFLGDGVHPTFLVDGGGSLTLNLFDFSALSGHAIKSTSTGSLAFFIDSSTVLTTQDAPLTPTIQFIDQSNQVAYSPAVPGHWNPQPPQVAQALDQLAAANFVELLDPGQAAAATITIPGSAITQKKSGLVTVVGEASLVLVGESATVTAQLIRDGTTPIGPVMTTIQSTGTFTMSVEWVDVLAPGGAPHTYTMRCAAGVGNTLSTAANTGAVIVTELT